MVSGEGERVPLGSNLKVRGLLGLEVLSVHERVLH